MKLRLEHDRHGRVVRSIEEVNGLRRERTYAYDRDGRLTGWSDEGLAGACAYDATGRRRRIAVAHRGDGQGFCAENYGYTPEHRLRHAGPRSYGHDASGRRNVMHHEEGTTRYRYDGQGRLTTVEQPDGVVLVYSHDDMGRLAASYRCGQLTQTCVWLDQLRLHGVGMQTSRGWMRGRFVHGEDSLLPRYMVHDFGVFRLHYDHVGSLRVVEGADGSVWKETLFDPFGNLLLDTAPDFVMPLWVGGGLCDPDTGWVRLGRRIYDPRTAHWIGEAE